MARKIEAGKPRYRELNNNWRGGKSFASNGYVLIRVGVDHHLADVRGYAYEHRLVAESIIGRRLRKGELIHHINGDKKDNRPENLLIANGNGNHYVYHRKNKSLQLPGEKNVRVSCGCGCGGEFLKFDLSGRPRRYLPSHNSRRSYVKHKD